MAKDTGLFLRLVNYCNTQINNTNEYHIAKIILENISVSNDLSLEALADQANISQASVSRFIKKAGFNSYQEFREATKKAVTDISLNRQLQNVTRFILDNDEAMVEKLYQESVSNLAATRVGIDLAKLNLIVEMMKTSSSVSFFGDDHGLSLFYTLQLDILVNGTPAYLFKKEEFQQLHVGMLEQEALIVFLNVFDGFIPPSQKEMLVNLKKRGVKTVIFCQDRNDDWTQYFDVVYYYGQEKTLNVGFYSLYYLSIVLSELYYHHRNL